MMVAVLVGVGGGLIKLATLYFDYLLFVYFIFSLQVVSDMKDGKFSCADVQDICHTC